MAVFDVDSFAIYAASCQDRSCFRMVGAARDFDVPATLTNHLETPSLTRGDEVGIPGELGRYAGTLSHQGDMYAAVDLPDGRVMLLGADLVEIARFPTTFAMSDITNGTPSAGVCAGTRIAAMTERCVNGHCLIERLRPGDPISTADGSETLVVELRRERIMPELGPETEWAPIRVRADVLAPGMPDLDLYVSTSQPIHGSSGHATPAKARLDGNRIMQVSGHDLCDPFWIYSIVTIDGAQVLANGMPIGTEAAQPVAAPEHVDDPADTANQAA